MLRSTNPSTGHHTPGTIDLVISNPAALLNEIARRYETGERILMEYLDNSLDDAEALFQENGGAYPYPIEIDLDLDMPGASVTIRDNCRGMTRETLEGIVGRIGESNKRNLPWVNGRFGFGVHAFRAAAESIHIETRHARSSYHTLEFSRDQLYGIKEARRSDELFPSATGSGTIVTVGKFDREWFGTLNAGSVRREIERHFERLLGRPNLSIRVGEKGGPRQSCSAFDYRALAGVEFERHLSLEVQGEHFPVELYLKVAAEPQPEHCASFYARGRRVAALAEIKSFLRKSGRGAGLWGHPHLCGYVEVGEIAQPILNRDEFARSRRRQALYEAIIALEPEIFAALQSINQNEMQLSVQQIEDSLSRAAALQVALAANLPEGAERRWVFHDGVLCINMAHADFQQRLSKSRQGAPRLTDRMRAYLAALLAAAHDHETEAPGAAQLEAFLEIEAALWRMRAAPQ